MHATKLYQKLNTLDYSKVDRRVDRSKLNGCPVSEVKAETLKFLALCATDEQPNAPSKVVDEYWHAMILNTELHQKVSKVLGTTIHHDQHVPKYAKFFGATQEKLTKTFGKINPKIWNGYANCGYGGCGSK